MFTKQQISNILFSKNRSFEILNVVKSVKCDTSVPKYAREKFEIIQPEQVLIE